jgi:hypothetical protein
MKRTLIGIAAAVLLPTLAGGQANLRTAPSTRATTQVSLAPPTPEGQPGPPPILITIDYGQPHARGRQVAGALADDLGKAWRLGANAPTRLTTGVDLVIGGATVPKGSYILYAVTTPGAWQLAVNKDTSGQEMTPSQSSDVARVPLKSRTLSTPVESLTMWLIPGPAGALNGELRIAWGSLEHSVGWSVNP